jgi:glutamine synthetase
MDPRNVAKRADEQVRAKGGDKVWIQPELEFYLLKTRETLARERAVKEAISPGPLGPPEVHTKRFSSDLMLLSDYTIPPKAGYFAPVPLDITDAFRNEFSYQLDLLGVPIKYHHHEGGGKQVEIEFKHMPSVKEGADTSVLYKFLSRVVAHRFGFIPTYMPKPLDHDAGNGMHIHQWLERDGRAVFHDPDDEYGLSQEGRYYIGGIMEHARAMCAVTNPTVNSYKRLVPEFEAPVYVAWSPRNRTALIRIPSPFSKKATGDIEVRHPDTSANPYLAFAAVVHAGLDGIRHKTDPGDPILGDVSKLSRGKLKKLGIERLPATLEEALEAMETDDLVRRALGRELFDVVLEMKSRELLEHNVYVSPWEIEHYFDI